MKIETLNERIEKTAQKIERKRATIAKKQGWITKAQKQMESADEMKRRELDCDVRWWGEDIRRIESEIKESESTLEKYQKQLAGEIARESTLIREVPETLKRLQAELVEKWDGWDLEDRARYQKAYKELGYSEFVREYGWRKVDEMRRTDEEIHADNVKDAEDAIINLLYRVRDVVGEITDWSHVTLSGGVLNGYITGKEGRCEVETIGAGGYNIQRFHLRVLVKKIS